MFFFGRFCLHMTLVDITIQPQLGLEAIRSHRAARFHRCRNKALQGCSRQIRDRLQPEAPNSPAVLHSPKRYRLGLAAPGE
jgi:hypothetical protein